MELKEKNNAGKMETWRVEDGVKRKGPCSISEVVTMNDGVAVVRNNQSLNKIPKVEGLLSYLLDDRKLYIKEKSQWEALATQTEVKNVIGELKRFKQEVNNKFITVEKATIEVVFTKSVLGKTKLSTRIVKCHQYLVVPVVAGTGDEN